MKYGSIRTSDVVVPHFRSLGYLIDGQRQRLNRLAKVEQQQAPETLKSPTALLLAEERLAKVSGIRLRTIRQLGYILFRGINWRRMTAWRL